MTMMLFSLGLGLRWAEVLDEAAAGALAKYVVKVRRGPKRGVVFGAAFFNCFENVS